MKRAFVLGLLIFVTACAKSADLSVAEARASADRSREKKVAVVGYYFPSIHGDVISPSSSGVTDDSIALASETRDAKGQLSYASLKTGDRYTKQRVRIRGSLKRGRFPLGPGEADDYVFLVVDAVEKG